MVEAAHDLFAEGGYAGTTMQAIAARAGVATQTLYFVFNTKPDLFRAVIAFASAGAEDSMPVHQRSWYREAAAAAGPRRKLELLVEGGAAILARLAPLTRAIEEAASVEPTIEEYQRGMAASRREGIRHMVGLAAANGALRRGLTVEQAADIAFVLCSPDSFRRFSACGWSLEDWTRWIAQSLPDLILV
jgi:AcrR family transcriptional regulator